MLTALNKLGHDNGIGRVDLVENRFVGMKSRGIYETPGGTILLAAHRGMESLTLDRGAAHLKDDLMPRYAELIYNGFWFSPEREMLQALIDKSQEPVSGTVRVKLYKGSATVVGRKSPNSLYSLQHVTFEEDAGAYDQRDAQGFIKLNALRLQPVEQARRQLSGMAAAFDADPFDLPDRRPWGRAGPDQTVRGRYRHRPQQFRLARGDSRLHVPDNGEQPAPRLRGARAGRAVLRDRAHGLRRARRFGGAAVSRSSPANARRLP